MFENCSLPGGEESKIRHSYLLKMLHIHAIVLQEKFGGTHFVIYPPRAACLDRLTHSFSIRFRKFFQFSELLWRLLVLAMMARRAKQTRNTEYHCLQADFRMVL
jgi:hypothetical protein